MSYYKPDKCPMCRLNIAERICSYYHTSIESVQSKSRKQYLVSARFAIVYVMENYLTHSSLQKKALIINRDHATVIHFIHRIENKRDTIAQKVIQEMTALFS